MEKLLGWVWRDLRFAFHSLSRDKRFALLAVLALALGIGSVTVIFSAIDGVLIDTFPYTHYDHMVSFSASIAAAKASGKTGNTFGPVMVAMAYPFGSYSTPNLLLVR